MAKQKNSKSKSKIQQKITPAKKNKHSGAKPIPTGDSAPPAHFPTEPGIHTKYDAFGGYRGLTRAQSRMSRLIEQQKLDRPKTEKIAQKLALLFLYVDTKKQWQKDITEFLRAKAGYEKRKKAGENVRPEDDPLPSELSAFDPVKHQPAFKAILAVFHKRKYQRFNTVIDKDISSIYPDLEKTIYPVWFLEQALHIIEMAEAGKSVKPENQAMQINDGNENITDKKTDKSEINSTKLTRETHLQIEKDFRAWLEATPVHGQKQPKYLSRINEFAKNRTDAIGWLMYIFSYSRFLPAYWLHHELPNLAEDFEELQIQDRMLSIKKILSKNEYIQLVNKVNEVYQTWMDWRKRAIEKGIEDLKDEKSCIEWESKYLDLKGQWDDIIDLIYKCWEYLYNTAILVDNRTSEISRFNIVSEKNKENPQTGSGAGDDNGIYRAINLAERTVIIGTKTHSITSEKVWEFLKNLCSAFKEDRLVPRYEGTIDNKNSVDQLRRLIGKAELSKWIISVRKHSSYKLNPTIKILKGGQLGIKKTKLSSNPKNS